jgi:PAS domain S-box-containing protein
VVQVRGTIQDITVQKRRVQELKRYERLVENLPVGIFRTTESGEFVDMNEALTDLFGVSEEHLRRAGSGMMYANPEDRAALLEVLRREGKVEGELFPMQTRNGEERWTRTTITLTQENGDRYLEGIIEDVTERRRAEQALRQREQRFRSLFEEHSAPMLLIDPETGAIERANDAASAFYGYDAPELASMTVQDLNVLPPEEVAARRADAEQRAQNRFVFPHQLASGEVRMVEVHSTPVTIEDQSLLFSIIHDITERKEKEREARLRSDAIEASTDGIAIIGADGTYVYVNEAHAEAHGYDDSDAMLGQSWRICYGEEALARFDEDILPRLHDEGEWRGEVTGQTADGASFPQELTLTTFGGGVTISVVRDITEQKRREAVLRERQEKIEALYEATRRLLRAESREEIADEIHGVLQDVFAYPLRHTAFVEEDEIVAQNTTAEDEADLPHLPSHPSDGDSVAARALAAGEAVVVPDTQVLDTDIEYGDLRAAAGVPIGDRGVIIVGTTDDGDFDRLNLHLLEVLGGYTALVLERLRRERALRDAKEGAEAARAEAEAARDEARKAARLKAAFLANMSHEIRTPLTSIIGFAEVLGNEIEDLDAVGAESLGQKVQLIREGGNRLLDTLEGVLNLSKLEAGQMELDSHPVDLAAQARRTAEELRPKADDKAIDLQVQAADPLPRVQADEGGVQIVIQNLLSNAIKYTEEGGKVWIRACADDEAVVLEVEDTGIGMEPGRAEELFEPFRQASEGMSREYEGSGVGLAVTRRAVTEMGGCVEVETEKGEGSRFIVRLPQAEPSSHEQTQVESERA